MPPSPAAGALESLVEAERGFARGCVARGIRASFLEFFAADGVGFYPAPENTRQRLLAQPAPPSRPPVTLDWQPIAADVSAAGDLGWTTGPYTLADDTGAKPPGHGYYFSVWRREPDGTWRVAADLGVTTPAPAAPPVFAPAHAAAATRPQEPLERDDVLDLDRALARACASGPPGACFAGRLHDDVRVHREGRVPLVGAPAAREFLERAAARPYFEPLGGGVSRSGDLAFTYGRYGTAGSADTQGYYLRVWRREQAGWRIAADVANVLPEGR